MDEILRILPQAWSGEPFRHQGEVYDLPTLGVRPRPSTQIPVLIGGSAEPAVRRAARLADGLFANAPVDTFVKEVGWVLDECERIGRDPATFRFIHYSVLLPGPSREAALARYADALYAMQWKYSDMEDSAARPLPAADAAGVRRRPRVAGHGPLHLRRTARPDRRGHARHPAPGRRARRVRRAQPLPAARAR